MALPGFPELQLGGAVQFTAVARGLAAIVLGAMVVLFLLVLFPKRAVRVLERLVGVLPAAIRRPIIDALEAFLAGVSILRDPVLLIRATLWSVVLWLVNALGFYLGMRAFEIDLPYVAAVFLQSCVAIAVSVPSAPGFFGPFEAATSVVLVDMWSIDASKALGFALGFHIAGFIPITLMGLFYAWRMGLSLRGMARSEEVVETAVERESGVDPDNPDAAHQRSAGR
jgi:glycosyltransferase 2 family protein